MSDNKKLEEGWWKPSQSRKYHYFVEGRSLCGSWGFPNYDELAEDITTITAPQSDDCVVCFRKLLKRRVKK